jgi:DNA-binding Lrp family transcriptional regulator
MIARVNLDEADIRILAALQQDGALSIALRLEAVDLSHNLLTPLCGVSKPET